MTRQTMATVSADEVSVPDVLARVRGVVEPELRNVVDLLEDPQMRRIARYQMGWCDAEGRATDVGGKLIRPALAVLSAEAVLGRPDSGIPGAVAVELVHNFSLLHDDVMDRDLERRHRPTGWVVFGEGQAILAGSALLALAVQVLDTSGIAGRRSLPALLEATQLLIGGQSRDLLIERQESIGVDDVLEMEARKTAALMSCATSIGSLAAGAPEQLSAGLAAFGYELGLAFQLVDDILGVVGDSAATGKSASSDVRAGKRSAPIVAALAGDSAAAAQLGELLAGEPPSTEDDVALATRLIEDAGGLDWAAREAEARMANALDRLESLELPRRTTAEFTAIAHYVVERDR